jgi:uncharacterized small protein (DUF1192 family)
MDRGGFEMTELKRCPYCGSSLISTGQPPAKPTNLTDKDGNELLPVEDELNARIKELEAEISCLRDEDKIHDAGFTLDEAAWL